MKTIRVYWWNKGPGRGNFGDELGPAIVRVLARARVEWAPPEQADIVSIGSVLEPWFWRDRSAKNFNGIIWGSGRMNGKRSFAVNPDSVTLLRGPLIFRNIEGVQGRKVPSGDPGLLAELFVRSQKKKYTLGLVPHWSQRSRAVWKELVGKSRNVCVIDPSWDHEKVVQVIAQCETIGATSLHALIVADALNIPRIWLSLVDDSTTDATASFKFADYHASLGLTEIRRMEVTPNLTAEAVFGAAKENVVTDLSRIKQDIWNSFPL